MFVLGQRIVEPEAHIHAQTEFIIQTQDELLREKAQNDALNRDVETLSARSNQLRLLSKDPL